LRRLSFALVALTSLWLVMDRPLRSEAQQGGAPAQDTPTFRSSAEAVQITAIVTDTAGNPVSGLTEDDFEIIENNVPQAITTFSAVDIPIERTAPATRDTDVLTNEGPPGRLYLIALDEVANDNALRTRHFLRDFIEQYFGPNDRAAVVLVGRGLSTSGQEFTSNPLLLLDAIDKFSGGFPDEALNQRNKMATLRDLTEFMAKVPGTARKAMIFVSEGVGADALDLVDYHGGVLSIANEDFQAAVSAATRGNVAIYPLDPRGLSPDVSGPGIGSDLRSLAQVTGGFALTNSNSFKETFERLVRENSTYYILGFNSSYEKRNARYVRLQVRVKRPDLIVNTLDGYVAPHGKEKAPNTKPSTLLSAVSDAVKNPIATSGVPLRMFAAPFKSDGKTPDGKNSDPKNATIAIALELDPSKLGLVQENGVYKGELEIVFAVTDAKNKRWPLMRHRAALALKPDTYERARRSGLRVLARLALPEGRYQIRASAGASTLAGSIVYDLKVPKFDDDFSMSGVTVTSNHARDAVTVSPYARLGVALPGPPMTTRSFSQDDSLTLYVEAYEHRQKPHSVEFTVQLLKESGDVVATVNTTRTAKELSKNGSMYQFSPGVALDELAPGRYHLHVEARSSLDHKPISRDVQITVQ
jgi:VWFA-related protein